MPVNRVIPPLSQPRGCAPNAASPIAYLLGQGCFVNLAGDYRYMSAGYYASQDLEAKRNIIHPTCQEILDAYVVPLFLEKARLAGLCVPQSYLTNDHFDPPVIVDAVNPFMSRQSIVLKPGHQERVAKSLTRNYTYAICCQELPLGARIGYARLVLGWSSRRRYAPLASAVWEIFHIPLAVLRVISLMDGQMLYSGLKPLPYEALSVHERSYVQKRVSWQT